MDREDSCLNKEACKPFFVQATRVSTEPIKPVTIQEINVMNNISKTG